MATSSSDVKRGAELVSKESVRKNRFERERLIVYVWTSGFNPNNPGENIGHVAIEAPERFYLSLWPTETGKQSGQGILTGIQSELKPNLEADLRAEGRPPEITLCFYKLDVTLIKARYDDIAGTTRKKWSLHGLAFCQNAESCASSAWSLLAAGGINELNPAIEQSSVGIAGSSTGSSVGNIKGSSYASEMFVSPLIKSPDAVAEFLKIAKQKELKREPLTQQFRLKPREIQVLIDPSDPNSRRKFVVEETSLNTSQDKRQKRGVTPYFEYLKKHPKTTAALAIAVVAVGATVYYYAARKRKHEVKPHTSGVVAPKLK